MMKTGKQNLNWIEKKIDLVIDQCFELKLDAKHFQANLDENVESYFEEPKFGLLDYCSFINTENDVDFLQCLNETLTITGLIDLGLTVDGIFDLSLQIKNVETYHVDDLSEFKYTLA